MNTAQNTQDQESPPLELLPQSAIEALERAQIDMQVSTAKRYPRSVKKFLEDARSMIAADLETAESCNYKLKRKGRDGEKFIEGPSIRLLEIAASSWTNIRYGSRIINIDNEFVTAQGVSHDMERNVASSVEVKRSISGKFGRYSQDMIMVTANAAGAIARRNALNGVVPRSYINQLSDYAKQIAMGDIKSLPERRQKAFDYFTKTLLVPLEKLLAYLEKPSVEDCTLEDLDKLTGLKTALKDGETTLEAEFPADPKKPVSTGPAEDKTKTAAEVAGAINVAAIENPFTHIQGLCKADGVTEKQIHLFMQSVKLAGAKTEELAQCSNENMRTVIGTWAAVLPKIKAIKVE